MRIKLNKCSGDWYTIIRAEHDGKSWFEKTGPGSTRFMSSERLTPEACIEDAKRAVEAKAFEQWMQRGKDLKSFGDSALQRISKLPRRSNKQKQLIITEIENALRKINEMYDGYCKDPAFKPEYEYTHIAYKGIVRYIQRLGLFGKVKKDA